VRAQRSPIERSTVPSAGSDHTAGTTCAIGLSTLPSVYPTLPTGKLGLTNM